MKTPRRKSRTPALRLGGDLNIYTVATVQQQLLKALNGGQPIDLDLGEVSEFDSAGVQQLLVLKRECDALGRGLRITAISDSVREVFTLLNLNELFAVPASAT